jgi:hypothetical protein
MCYRNSKSIKFWKIIIAVFLVDIIFPFQNNIIENHRYELFWVMIQAYAVNCIVFSLNKRNNNNPYDNFIKLYVALGFVSIFIRAIFGKVVYGRYSIQGLGVGATGFLCATVALYLIYCQKYTKSNSIILIMTIIGLVMSGNRTNLLVFLMFLIPFFVKIAGKLITKNNVLVSYGKYFRLMLFLIGALITFLIIILTLRGFGVEISGFDFVYRTLDTIKDMFYGTLSSDGSVEGRTASLKVGLDILKQNPIGITNDFYELQYLMISRGYITFPHSTLLSTILLWTLPISIYVVVYYVRLIIGLKKKKDNLLWVMLYIGVMSIVWGSPLHSCSMLFIYLFYFTIAKRHICVRYG